MNKEELVKIFDNLLTTKEIEKYIMSLSKEEASILSGVFDFALPHLKNNLMSIDGWFAGKEQN